MNNLIEEGYQFNAPLSVWALVFVLALNAGMMFANIFDSKPDSLEIKIYFWTLAISSTISAIVVSIQAKKIIASLKSLQGGGPC